MTDRTKLEYCKLVFEQVCNPNDIKNRCFWLGKRPVCTCKEPKQIIIDEESFRKIFGSYGYISDIPKEDLTRIYIMPARHQGKTLAMEMFKTFCKNYFGNEE